MGNYLRAPGGASLNVSHTNERTKKKKRKIIFKVKRNSLIKFQLSLDAWDDGC